MMAKMTAVTIQMKCIVGMARVRNSDATIASAFLISKYQKAL